MEWYFDNQVEDLAVPEDCEFDFDGGDNFYPSIDMSSKSNNSSSIYNNNAASLLLNDQANFQQFTEEINHMDDIFLYILYFCDYDS